MKDQTKTIKELASYFDKELQTKLPISVLPDGSLVYKNFLVRQLDNENWGVFNIESRDLVNQYYLKSCALVAAKAYNYKHFNKYFEIENLDKKYQTNYHNFLVLKNNIKSVSDSEKYHVMLTRLEESSQQAYYYKQLISRLLRRTFV